MSIHVTTKTGVGGAAQHVRRALEIFREWIRLASAAKKQQARKATVQFGATLVFGVLVLLWVEVGFYLLFTGFMKAHWAAFLLLFINAGILAAINLAVSYARRHDQLAQEASAKMAQATNELVSAREQLVATRDRVAGGTQHVLENRIIAPYERYRVPAAAVGTFALGLLLARALFPRAERNPATDSLIIDREMQSLID